MSSTIPTAWSVCSIGDVSKALSGVGFPKTLQGRTDGEIPFFKVGDISRAVTSGESQLTKAQHCITKAELAALRTRVMPANTIVFAKIGEAVKLNRRAVLAQPSLVDNNVMALVPEKSIVNPMYLLWFMRTVKLSALTQATTVPSVRKGDVERIGLPLAPLPEQHRIVEAIESYLTRLDDAKASLERVQRNLERYRASVLKAAVEGRLVPTEAELARREGRDYEPASELLKRILAERKTRWIEDAAEKALAKAEEKARRAGKPWTPEDDARALQKARKDAEAKYKEPAPPDTTDLPEGWCWSTLMGISSLVTDGDHNPPKRVEQGIPHLTARHVKDWTLLTERCSFISEEGFERTRARYEPRPRDIILTCVGTVGEAAIVPEGLVFSADRNLAGIRLAGQDVLPEYVLSYLSAPDTQISLRRLSGSTAQPHLYLGDLRQILLPLPPRAEQLRIIAVRDRLLSITASVWDAVALEKERCAALHQSILKWAFEGKLVEQDPNDEPAPALLKRIKQGGAK